MPSIFIINIKENIWKLYIYKKFFRTFFIFYTYIILIVTLVAIIAGTIIAFRIGLDIMLPEKSTYDYSYSSQEREHNENIIELFSTISLVITSIPVFIYHNKLAKKSKMVKVEEIKK